MTRFVEICSRDRDLRVVFVRPAAFSIFTWTH